MGPLAACNMQKDTVSEASRIDREI
jgi:hypothetical protein